MSILEQILEVKRREIAVLKQNRPVKEYDDSSLLYKPTLSLINTIRKSRDISIIAEVKKRVLQKGFLLITLIISISQLNILKNGADAISVITDEQFFKGSIDHLHDIALIKNKPLLRKDFIIDETQIFQARENGADAVLLICEALTKESIRKLTKTAQLLGMEVLLELHSIDQIAKIDFSLNKLIGVNNRDLTTFITDLKTTEEIRRQLPDDILLVSESGIKSKDDIARVRDAGCDAVLVGEHFIRSVSIGGALREMKEWCKG
ncbi:MAG: indole-3-glycerol-phosphate synthase [Ignavibacteriales bacterium]|nr:indole-3-glycerol-phosphate synthase [Ignavibacteriales bacterium]